jgi:ribosomal protein L11 methyltransferase
MIRVELTLPARDLTAVENILYEIAPSNWVIIINKETRGLTLSGLFSTKGESLREISNLKEYYDGFLSDFIIKEIDNKSWEDSYRHHFKSWKYNSYKFIPLWDKAKIKVNDEEIPIYIDPGMAFGTGEHETTRLCIEFLIDKFELPEATRDSFLDVGCGSGILSILAKSLGFKNVLGIDHDENAISNSIINTDINLEKNSVIFKKAKINSLEKKEYKCIVANIQSDVLISNAKSLINMLAPSACLIISGILNYETKDVIKVYNQRLKATNFTFKRELKQKGEWSTVCYSLYDKEN